MSFLGYTIIILAGIGMVVGLIKQKRGIEWGKPLTVVCAVVALLFAMGNLFTGGNEAKKLQAKYQEWNESYNLITGEKIGRYITDKFGSGEVVVLTMGDGNCGTIIEGLRKGLGDGLSIVREVKPDFEAAQREMMKASGMDPAEMPEGEAELMMDPMMMDPMMMSPELIDDALAEVGDADIVVNLVSLPYEYLKMEFWQDKDHPKFIMASTGMGMGLPELKSMIEVGHIAAYLSTNPKGQFDVDAPIPEDLDEAFGTRYILVDKDNVAEMAENYPELFMSM